MPLNTDSITFRNRESAAADAENALNDVAIPYLKQIKSAMAGNFTFDVQRDVTSNRTLGVKFEVKEREAQFKFAYIQGAE
jgi:hypothetical protein